MKQPRHAIAVLALAVTLAWPAAARARRSLNKVDRELKNIEGQLSYYLTTIKPPKQTMTKRERGKRLIDGMVLYRMKDYSRAAIVLMDIVSRFPGTSEADEAAFFLADSMFQQREFVVARKNFQKVVQSGRSNPYYQLALQRLLELEMRRAAVLGQPKTADAERFRQVEALLRKIESIPPGRREDSVDYVRGKYLFFRERVAEALKVFSGLGRSHPYHLQAVYFIGVCHIKAGRLNAAQATYKQLIDAVIFNRLKLENATERKVLQLIIMAAARLAYVRGKEPDVERAIELYNAVPRKSAYFDDALYERAWAYLKAKRYDRAVQALEMLNVANPKYGRADEARVLLGNLKIQTKDFGGAKAIFRKAANSLRPVVRKLRGLQDSGIEPKVIFNQLTSDNLDKFDIEIRLPKLALRWLRKQPELKRAMMVLDDMKSVQAMIEQSHKLIRAIERKLRLGSQISRFPALAAARARAADFETQLLRLRTALAAHLRDLVRSLMSAEDRARLDRLRKRRKELAARLEKLPKSSDAYNTRLKKIRELFDQIDSDALTVQLEVKNLENMLKAIESYYFRTIERQRVPKAVMKKNLAAVRKQIRVLKGLVQGLREDLADGKNNIGIGDAVMVYEKRLRKQYRAVLQREQQITAAAAQRLTPDKARRKARIDALLGRIGKAQQNLKGVNQRIDGYLAAKRAEVLRVLAEEKAKLSGYRQQVKLFAPSSQEVVGGVALQNFRKVSQRVQSVLVKADVGVLDVVWAIKNLAKGRYEKRESLFMRAMEALKRKYREPRGMK